MLGEVVGDSCYEWCFGAGNQEVKIGSDGVLDEGGKVGLFYIGDVLAFGYAGLWLEMV